MKKSLVLAMAMAMALGITASAYAANPFSDVPQGHWAYDSVAKLAEAGVVEESADGEFGGDKLLTRYEMAQITAKAMAKGANVDKLAAEFADELDSLGVRVANLENKADNVKVTGEIRYHYADVDYSGNHDYDSALRSRIWLQGAVNEDWRYTGMLQNMQYFDNETGDEEVEFKRAYVEGKIGGVNVLAGRYNAYLVNGNLYDEHADGIELSYGKDVKLTAFAMKPTDQNGDYGVSYKDSNQKGWWEIEYEKAYGIKVDTQIGVVDVSAGYTVFDEGADNAYLYEGGVREASYPQPDNKIWNVGAEFDLAKDLVFRADYMKSDMDGLYSGSGKKDVAFSDDDGYVIGLSYKGAKASETGTYGLYANYYDQGRGTVIAHTMNGFHGYTGFKGYMLGANYTLAKNIVASVEWYDLTEKAFAVGDKHIGEFDMETIWTQVTFTF